MVLEAGNGKRKGHGGSGCVRADGQGRRKSDAYGNRPFKDRKEAFEWEGKNRKDKGISRIEVKNVIPV